MVHIFNRYRLIHRLVAEAFLGERPTGMLVHHKDNDKANARPENLMYASASQNTKWAYADGRIGSHYKLSPFQRAKVVELYMKGDRTIISLAKQFDVSREIIRNLVKSTGIKRHNMKKLTPALYTEIRSKWVPFKYPVRMLAEEYKVSCGMVEYILGQRANRGRWLPKPPLPWDSELSTDAPK